MARRVTCVAPSNIATIKYWGKRDETLILPVNDSISVTLSVDVMRAKTTAYASPDFKENRMWLNGKEETFADNKRLVNCLAEIQEIARKQSDGKSEIIGWKLHICSENNFPTAAGLASSAAGYACFVYAIAQLYGLEVDLSSLARRGSGSACRSLHGGFVQWHMGQKEDGSDSIATQLAPASHWPELRILILIIEEGKKTTSSTSGMSKSVETSEFLQHRMRYSAPKNITSMKEAILSRDFGNFAELTMRDSNQFHAVCLDTYPPIIYLNDTSRKIVEFVHHFNKSVGETRLGYSFDAGANACLFFLQKDAPLVLSLVNYLFPQAGENFKGIPVEPVALSQELLTNIAIKPHVPGIVKGLILSDVGSGPKILNEDEHLLGQDGLPFLLAL